jgi:acetylornithine deacetylase/succinyl-diaminopimelate desuccinylase-like protein
VGDNSRSLAVLLAMARALNDASVATRGDILFVGNVGEEGQGDLRGVRYLFTRGPYRDRINLFIAIDGGGHGSHIVNAAVGSRRYRVTFTGPGGHSYGAFGLVNPAFALGAAIEKLSRTTVPASPRTTFNVGLIGGGTSVNTIPAQAWMDVDMRSESGVELARLERQFKTTIQEAADAENAARSTGVGRVQVEWKLIGDRPWGETPRSAPIVETAAAVVRHFGDVPSFGAGSTDANIPISLGIPAIAIDSGGLAGRSHATDEWIDVEKAASLRGVQSALVLLVTLAGVE